MQRLIHRTATHVALVVILAVASVMSTAAAAASLIGNGGFETGLAGWTRADAIGSDGTFFCSRGLPVPLTAIRFRRLLKEPSRP